MAVVDVVLECGYERTTVEAILERAEVSRSIFERHFKDLRDCVLQTYWENSTEFNEVVFGAFEAGDTWRDSLRAAAYAAARFLRENPRLIQFGMIDMSAAGTLVQAERERHLHRLVEMIDAGRQELDDPDSVSRSVAEGIFGSIYETLMRRLQAGRGTASAEEFVPELMYLAVRPYLGHEVAREELTMPPPEDPTGED